MWRILLGSMLAMSWITNLAHCAEAVAKIVLTSPSPHEVVQREGFVSTGAYDRHSNGPTLGIADVIVKGTIPNGIEGHLQIRRVLITATANDRDAWTDFNPERNGQSFEGPTDVPAGGWYRLDIRCVANDKTIAQGSSEPFGVGDLFLIAGGSIAAGVNQKLLNISEPQGRVSAYHCETNQWRVANDPQPRIGDGGTIWPALGDLLVPTLRVPIGFVNVAESDTSINDWLPGSESHKRLVKAGRDIGAFRAVLWQQGETDVLKKTPTETYVRNLIKIRESAARAWEFEPTWLLAKSTLGPIVENDPNGEERIRSAIHLLWKRPHFAPGPDIDLLSDENRTDPRLQNRLSEIGQRRAALLWFVAIWNETERQSK